MSRRATALGILSSVVLTVVGPVVETPNCRADAQEIGQYVVGAGLGLLLGSFLFRNSTSTTGATSTYPYYGSSTSVPQPTVTYGWYSDGYTSTYGPIVVPPPGYVQPSTSVTGTIINPATGQPTTGTIINPATGQPVTTAINPATGQPITETVINPATGQPVTGTLINGQAAPAATSTTTGTTTTTTTLANASARATAGMAQHLSTNSLVHGLSSHLGSLSRAATSSVRTSAVHSAIQRVSRGSVSMIKNSAGRSLGRMF